MAGSFYSVDLTRDERMARNPRLVEKFLVELCQEHCPDNWQALLSGQNRPSLYRDKTLEEARP
jgi:hypothetical protein